MLNHFTYNINTSLEPRAGRILISEPMLPDGHFHRSVVYLCSHNDEGTLGFVINRKLSESLDLFVEDLQNCHFPVFIGGPVAMDSLHMLHVIPDLIGGDELEKGIYMGGDFQKAVSYIQSGVVDVHQLKFFIGYSGWAPNQLDKEIGDFSWLVSDCDAQLVFDKKTDVLWRRAIKNLGKDYEVLLNLPSSPNLN